MVPLYPVTKQVGGLQVVPRTNNDETQEYLTEKYGHMIYEDWLELPKDDKFIGTGKLLTVDPGCLILWDSRTIHGGYVGKGPLPDEERLLRLSMTVCHAPFSSWDRQAQPDMLQKRMEAVFKGGTTTHWPFEFHQNSFRDSCKKE